MITMIRIDADDVLVMKNKMRVSTLLTHIVFYLVKWFFAEGQTLWMDVCKESGNYELTCSSWQTHAAHQVYIYIYMYIRMYMYA